MKLYIKQKVFSIGAKFSVKDEAGNEEIVSIHKAWMSWGDTYELDISDDTDEITALAVVLAIDTVLDNANNSANG